MFYNRVPKCGSRSLYDTFLTLGEKRGVTVRKKAMGIGRDPTSRLHKIVSILFYFERIFVFGK